MSSRSRCVSGITNVSIALLSADTAFFSLFYPLSARQRRLFRRCNCSFAVRIEVPRWRKEDTKSRAGKAWSFAEREAVRRTSVSYVSKTAWSAFRPKKCSRRYVFPRETRLRSLAVLCLRESHLYFKLNASSFVIVYITLSLDTSLLQPASRRGILRCTGESRAQGRKALVRGRTRARAGSLDE